MDRQRLLDELIFKAVSSGGPGGQHANRASTKVELRFDLEASTALNEEEKVRIRTRMSERINSRGVIVFKSAYSRSQFQNKKKVTDTFFNALEEALVEEQPRLKRGVSMGQKQKRLTLKKQQSLKKQSRKKPDIDS